MLQAQSALYLGKRKEDGYMGYFSTPHCFLVFAAEEGMSQEEGKLILSTLKSQLTHARIHSLAALDHKISDLIVQLNIPMDASIAAGVLHENVLYLKTFGKGQVYMRRGKGAGKLVSGDNSASGYIKQFDCLIFTTALFSGLLGDVEDIKSFIGLDSPEEIVENLSAQEYEDDEGIISLFVEFTESDTRRAHIPEASDEVPKRAIPVAAQEEQDLPQELDMDSIYTQDDDVADHMAEEELEKHIRSDYHPPKENAFASTFNGIKDKIDNLHIQKPQKKSKKITMVVVGIIFVIFVWSVVFGYQRRVEAQRTEKISTATETVDQKLTEAEDVAFLNLDRSLALIAEAKAEVETVKREVGESRASDIQTLEQKIKAAENQIVKKEEVAYEEFYDLTLENQDATGISMYVDGENAAILDDKEGRVYVLSLEKKSLQKKTAGEASVAKLVTLDKDRVFIMGGNGVHQFTSDTKVNQVLDFDDEWGEIVSMFMYNGNIYMLDPVEGEIYKYVTTEKGLSEKSSYLQTEANLSDATSIAIDSSIYVSNGSVIEKYTRGTPENFKTSFPTNDVSLTKIYTNEDIEKLYAWDKRKGVIYIINKSGAYERQLKSAILTKASDFFVYNNAVYILSGSKIYTMGL